MKARTEPIPAAAADPGVACVRPHTLAIVIPALNEEDSIEEIIERSLAACDGIVAGSSVTGVEITVVSDGSTDRTVERASAFAGRINLIVFEKNRGYGAAIKEGWARSGADLLGFLDADGTCDPAFFGPLCRALEEHRADVALGGRLNKQSRMPLVRKLGNTFFSWLLTLMASRRVVDTASGMRVVRRSCLPRLFPLPDGLHFTPAMSARALLNHDLSIIEIPMPYHERQGESKLKLVNDGMRFLRVILDAAFLYRPSRPLGLLGLLALFAASILMVLPIAYYALTRTFLDWMIYRFVTCNLLGSVGLLMLAASYLAKKVAAMTVSGGRPSTWDGHVSRFFSTPIFWAVPAGLLGIGGVLVLPCFVEFLKTGSIYEHWSRFVAMSFLFMAAFILMVTRVLDHSLNLIRAQLRFADAMASGDGAPPRFGGTKRE